MILEIILLTCGLVILLGMGLALIRGWTMITAYIGWRLGRRRRLILIAPAIRRSPLRFMMRWDRSPRLEHHRPRPGKSR